MRAYLLSFVYVGLTIFLGACPATPPTDASLAATTQVPACLGNIGVCNCKQVIGQCTAPDEPFAVDASCNAQFCSNTFNQCGAYCGDGNWCTHGVCQPCNGTVEYVARYTDQGQPYYINTCKPSATPTTPTVCGQNSTWRQVDPGVKLTHISVGGDGSVWATDNTNTYIRTNISDTNPEGDTWSKVGEDKFSVIAVGRKDFVWGTRNDSNVYYRQGITTGSPSGTNWQPVPGVCSWISAALDSSLWCLSTGGVPFYRAGVSAVNPQGNGWTKANGLGVQIAVGNVSTVWHITGAGTIFSIDGASASTPGGTGWIGQDGIFKSISIGADGTVWGVNGNGNVFKRANITWVENLNTTLKVVAVGNEKAVWGIDANGSAVHCVN